MAPDSLRRRPVLWGAVFVAFLLTLNLAWILRPPHREPAGGQAEEQVNAAYRPLEARTRLVDTLATESLMDSIDHLPDFDDTVWVSGSISMEGLFLPPVSYRYERRYVPRLNRVRKILQQVQGQPVEPVWTRLKQELRMSVDGFEDLYQAHGARLDELAREGRGLDLDEPNEYYRRGIYAPVATYLLAELHCHDALPLLVTVFDQRDHLPVSRLSVFYAVLLLAREHPRDGLSPEALKALNEALQATEFLAGPEQVQATAWNAELEDTDFRAKLLGKDIGLDEQPQTALRVYPESVEQLEEMGEFSWYEITDVARELFVPLRRFVQLAYPPGT